MMLLDRWKFFLVNFILTLLNSCVKTEWVELPQFSDDEKVYRMPFVKLNKPRIPSNTEFTLIKGFPRETIRNSNSTIAQFTVDSVTLMPQVQISDYTTEYSPKKVLTTLPTERDSAEYVLLDTSEKNNPTMTTPAEYEEPERRPPNKTTMTVKVPVKDSKGSYFFQVLPLELFARVHQALAKIQQATFEAKQLFLKNFEKLLLRKIEVRLASVINPTRVKRGSGWDEHDDHVGFPSLEGALLAISFLTFAVYLIQLVMMMMRNLGNNTTPTTSTVLVNRSKHSRRSLTEESVNILRYIEEFPK